MQHAYEPNPWRGLEPLEARVLLSATADVLHVMGILSLYPSLSTGRATSGVKVDSSGCCRCLAVSP